MSRRAIFLLPLLLVPIIIGGIAGGLYFLLPQVTPTTALAPAASVAPATQAEAVPVGDTEAAPVPTLQPNQTAEFDAEDQLLTALFQERSPAVVAIRVQGNDPNAPSDLPFELPDLESPSPDESPAPDDAQPQEPDAPEFNFEAQGSGFLLDDQGHIVTNNHVVEGAERIEISFTNGLIVAAEVVGTDADADLAVLKVEQLPEGVQPLPLGDSAEVQVGQRAIAIGNPFGLQTTLTVGVVSARGRTLENRIASNNARYSIADVIQTDAAINPGNSGGPLFNSRGEIIGVNTAIRSESGSFEGVGYAVPSNTVRKVTTALIENGVYEHPYLGLAFSSLPLTTIVADELSLPVSQGVFVSEVVEGGPSDQAGVQGGDDIQEINGDPYPVGGDIILKINDRQVNTSADIIDYLATDTEVGQTVTLTVLRDGQQQEIPVTLGARPQD